MENGKDSLLSKRLNQSDKNVYVFKVLLNGKEHKGLTIKHSDIENGGKITFTMSPKASNGKIK